jgi:hypothetical protein
MGLYRLRKGKSSSFTGVSFKACSSLLSRRDKRWNTKLAWGRGGRPEAAKVKLPSPQTE